MSTSRRITMYSDWDWAVCAASIALALFELQQLESQSRRKAWHKRSGGSYSCTSIATFSRALYHLFQVTMNRRKVHCSIQRGYAIQQASRTIGKHRPWVKFNEFERKPYVITHEEPILLGFCEETGLRSTCRLPFQDLCLTQPTKVKVVGTFHVPSNLEFH